MSAAGALQSHTLEGVSLFEVCDGRDATVAMPGDGLRTGSQDPRFSAMVSRLARFACRGGQDQSRLVEDLTMPERDDDWYREQLLKRQKELEMLREVSSQARETVELDQSSVGRVSRIDAIQQQAMALATEQNRERDLQRIKSAFVRLDQGEYGYCVSCGEEIAENRLRLDPSVPTCIDCAQ